MDCYILRCSIISVGSNGSPLESRECTLNYIPFLVSLQIRNAHASSKLERLVENIFRTQIYVLLPLATRRSHQSAQYGVLRDERCVALHFFLFPLEVPLILCGLFNVFLNVKSVNDKSSLEARLCEICRKKEGQR
jgi:hypothetical protein